MNRRLFLYAKIYINVNFDPLSVKSIILSQILVGVSLLDADSNLIENKIIYEDLVKPSPTALDIFRPTYRSS